MTVLGYSGAETAKTKARKEETGDGSSDATATE
jgi:hypothetical protein